jgi:hypothetical protein
MGNSGAESVDRPVNHVERHPATTPLFDELVDAGLDRCERGSSAEMLRQLGGAIRID